MQEKQRNRFTLAQNFKICQAVTEHHELYRTMNHRDAAKHLSMQVGFEVDAAKMNHAAKELGLDISKYDKRKKVADVDDTKAVLFNLALVDVLKALVNVTVTHPDRLAALLRQIEDLEEMA